MVHRIGTHMVHQMVSKYLKRSLTGWYSYRRRVPTRLQEIIGKREFKQRLETKDETTALIRLAMVNEQSSIQIKMAERQASPDAPDLTVQEAIIAARQLLSKSGNHPDQKPVLPADYTPEDLESFQEARERWLALDSNFWSAYESTQTVSINNRTFETNYKRDDPSDVWQAAAKIVSGRAKAPIEPTWGEAVEQYLRLNKQEKRRDPHDQKKFEVKMRNLYDTFASFVGGADTKLKDITRQDARAFLETYRNRPKPLKEGSIGRYSSQLGAVFNLSRKEYQHMTISNPFEGLRNMDAERDDATRRRSFSPEEIKQDEELLRQKRQPELAMIGLLMIYTGCRTSEAAGLQVRDIALSSNAPHVKIRSNALRRLDKKGLERAVPLAAPLLEALRTYDLPDDPNASAFGDYGERSAHDNVSVQLNQLIRDKMGVSDPELVAYSTRHTMKDRGRAARIAPDVLDYLQGHKTRLSSMIATRYGTGVPPSIYQDDIDRIFTVAEWGERD